MNMRTILALMAFACMTDGEKNVYIQRGYNKPSQIPNSLSPERKEAIRKSYERNMHDYNIKGTIIRAKDRKTALKIYANRTKKGNN